MDFKILLLATGMAASTVAFAEEVSVCQICYDGSGHKYMCGCQIVDVDNSSGLRMGNVRGFMPDNLLKDITDTGEEAGRSFARFIKQKFKK